ncbi:Retrovirus-related Gag polyprotein [Cricetulus griseus]|uniref:Retrovirus-related Gag polyprotein n=1 Tax=Cricetulus griseus TaxID=10029 RepID=G3IFJ1_CRIGR|nr:Retrovirus-related Gag polyprotein [Cricetulus griseus]
MLLGQGRFVNQQTGYPTQLYDQINQIAIRAWKSIPNKGEVSCNLTKIIQGPMESFTDFVARMVEAAGRVFGKSDAAMPLIKQLVYEQCSVCVFPQDQQDPVWVPERLIGKSNMRNTMSVNMVMLLLLPMMSQLWMAKQRWGILSVFPRPMPVMYNAGVFPRLFYH